MYTSITLNCTEASTPRPSSSISMCLCVHVKLATQGIPRHPRFPFTGFFIICNMKRIMRCLCKSHRRSPCSADKIHLQIVTPVICCPFHTNFSTINHNKLKPYSSTLWVRKRVVKTANPRLAPIEVVLCPRMLCGSQGGCLHGGAPQEWPLRPSSVAPGNSPIIL